MAIERNEQHATETELVKRISTVVEQFLAQVNHCAERRALQRLLVMHEALDDYDEMTPAEQAEFDSDVALTRKALSIFRTQGYVSYLFEKFEGANSVVSRSDASLREQVVDLCSLPREEWEQDFEDDRHSIFVHIISELCRNLFAPHWMCDEEDGRDKLERGAESFAAFMSAALDRDHTQDEDGEEE